MKVRVFVVMLTTALALTACTGAGGGMERAEDAVESKLETFADALEDGADKVESAVEQAMTQSTQAPGALSEDEAQAIALKHAGLTADQVTDLRVNYEVDDGIAQYEVDFCHGQWEYDYQIHAETGEILSYDRDD